MLMARSRQVAGEIMSWKEYSISRSHWDGAMDKMYQTEESCYTGREKLLDRLSKRRQFCNRTVYHEGETTYG